MYGDDAGNTDPFVHVIKFSVLCIYDRSALFYASENWVPTLADLQRLRRQK